MMADFSHDLALLQHAYYVGELEVGRRAAERLLSQELTPDVADSVRKNRTFYTPTLAELGTVEHRLIDIKPAYPGWSLFNPTLLRHGEKLIGLVRSSNYKFDGFNYYPPPEDNGLIRTSSIYVEYDDDFRAVSTITLKDPNYPRTGFLVDGIEDCRLYSSGEQLYASGTVRNFAPMDGTCRIGVARIDLERRAFVDLEVPAVETRQHEKNWMPVLGCDCWLYTCGAHGETQLARRDGASWRIKSLGAAPRGCATFRGGTQLVPFFGGYLCAVHEVVTVHQRRVYEHRFVWFDGQLRVQKFSQPFYCYKKRAIEFAAGIALIGDRVTLSFGVEDHEARLLILDARFVAALLSL